MAAPKVRIVSDWNPSGVKAAQRDLGFMEKQAQGFSSSVMKSFGGLGAALGGMFAAGAVVDFFKQSAQAAMEDEKSMVALATAMENVGLASKNAQAEGLLQSMSLQVGIADDQLRPAFQKLVTVTRDVADAQALLQTATNLAAAGYGDLESATKALSAAANGNFTALQRLKVPIDQNIIAAKDFDGAIQSLNATVGGQAAAAAQTFSGQMARLNVAVGEATEAVGYSLLNGFDKLIGRLGGTGGVQQAILDAGNVLADFVDGVMASTARVGDLATQLIRLSSFGLVPAQKQVNALDVLMTTLKTTLANLAGPLVTVMMYMQEMGWVSDDAALAQGRAAEASRQAGLAGHYAKYGVKGLTSSMYDLADGAETAADSLAKTVMAANALALEHEHLGLKEKVTGKTTLDRYKAAISLRDALDSTSGSSRGAAAATDKLSEAQQRAADRAQKLKDDTAALQQSLQGLLQEISPSVASAATATFDSVNAQIDRFKAALQEARTYAQNVVSGFMGQLDLGKALDDAKATGGSIIEAFVAQGDKVVAFGNKLNALVQQGLSRSAFDDIMRLGYARGTEVADALANGNVAQNIANVNKVYGSVQTMAEQVAEAAKTAFYQAGLDLILSTVRAMVESLGVAGKGRRQLMSLMDDLAAAMSRNATITVGVVTTGGGSSATPAVLAPAPASASLDDWFSSTYPGVPTSSSTGNFYGGIATFAEGGIAMSATPGIFGEAGPEALIPLDRMGDFGGNTYQITVQAGVGDPRAIGKSVVEAITLFERSSGPVFARA